MATRLRPRGHFEVIGIEAPFSRPLFGVVVLDELPPYYPNVLIYLFTVKSNSFS